MEAVIELKGMQFRVSEGEKVKVPRLEVPVGERIELADVLLLSDGQRVRVGTPTVEGAKVIASVLEHGKDKKIIVFKMKRRKNYRRKRGHRQQYTLISVERIVGPNV